MDGSDGRIACPESDVEAQGLFYLNTKGRGLNSIPVRFALISLIFTISCALTLFVALYRDQSVQDPALWAALAGLVFLPPVITFLSASRLASAIDSLRETTEAIVAGDLSSPIDVDCTCEVGGLADSFRAMIGRLNTNIIRMNGLAYSDPVTGLANRAVVTHVLNSLATLEDCQGSVLFIDLDNFKKINDTLGHRAGDELLRMVSDRIIREGFGLTHGDIDDCTTPIGELADGFPEKPVFARFAGDEFVALFPRETHHAALEERAARVIAAVSKPFHVQGNEVRVSASIGIARMPVDTRDPDQILSYADLAMYAAKDAGKNRYCFFEPSLKDIAIERSVVEADLRKAIETEQLSLYFQPKVNVHSMAVEGVEALVRWDHPLRGRVSPDDFIGIAEQRGLMPDLGNCVLHMAVRQARAWLDAGTPMRIAINVSAAQFERPELVPEILSALKNYEVEPSLIEIEITETMVMSDFIRTQERMRHLRDVGVQISIDDFGTGFSNLSQLSRLPFSVLKVDKSLIADIGHNPKSEAIIKAIVHMAHALGHQVIAEGIEQPEQHAFVRRLGCDQAQGYLFGAAMPACSLPAWHKARAHGPASHMHEQLQSRIALAG